MAKTIVVVDGELVVRKVIQDILEREGFRVIGLSDPKMALVVIEAAKPVLVITNVSLPGMSGHAAMQMFKECCPDLPVLMVSGLPDSRVVQEWLKQDGFDAFPKPFTAQQLVKKVNEMIGGGAAMTA
jgi:DNA-binding NtrC family response regulator